MADNDAEGGRWLYSLASSSHSSPLPTQPLQLENLKPWSPNRGPWERIGAELADDWWHHVAAIEVPGPCKIRGEESAEVLLSLTITKPMTNDGWVISSDLVEGGRRGIEQQEAKVEEAELGRGVWIVAALNPKP